MTEPRRILLVKPSSLGDVIHALPVVSAIHRHWPGAELRWIIHPAWRSVVEGHPGVSETVLFPRDKFRGPSGWLRSVAWMRLLRDWRPDLAIDLQGLFRSALFARVSGASRIVGLSDAREGARMLHGELAPVDRRDHAVTRCLSVLGVLGIPQPERPEFLLPAGKLPGGFNPATPYLVLHPYARGKGKSLTGDMIRAFVKGVTGTTTPEQTKNPASPRIVLVGRGIPLKGLPDCVEDWSNRTGLLELIGILRSASFTVSSDSGPMHLAAAIRPLLTLAVHLWSDPLKVGPCFPESLVWKNGLIRRVSALDESCRGEGRVPTEVEMAELGRMAAHEISGLAGGFPKGN